MPKKKKKKSHIFKVISISTIALILLTAITLYLGYFVILKPNVNLKDKKFEYLYIPTGSTFMDVKDSLYKNNFIQKKLTFEWMVKQKNYSQSVKPGRYKIKNKMSNSELINMLRSGKQEPLNITFNNIRTKEKLASVVSSKLELDSAALVNLLNKEEYLVQFGVNSFESLILFIPNTYQFYWNTSAEQFIERMHKEYEKFWTLERKEKCSKLNLTRFQVSIIASIVQEETNKTDEMSRIAGVYYNRLNKNWPLQADPTVKFALGNFMLKRILNSHLQTESPYNTYKYTGLPPGPICLPSKTTIEKVLNLEKHSYMFFCAKDDFSGYHAFAETHAQHIANAAKYHKALNKRNIR